LTWKRVSNVFKTSQQFAGAFFSTLWRDAFVALSTAQEVFLIGHSLGAGDLHFTTMLREAFWLQHRRVRLNIVNPAPDAVLQRIREEHLTTFIEPIVVGSTLAELASGL
jgi:hypothetical protein